MTGDVAPQGSGDEVVPMAQLRASHEDRDRVVEMLRVAAGDGRLTAEELDERLEFALTARTYGELTALTADLPASGLESVPLAASVPVPPKELARIDCHSGNAKRDGRWVVPKRMEVRVTSGGVRLDFTEAIISDPLIQIDAQVRSGSLTIVTKPGIVVDADDVAVRSGRVRVRAPWGPDVPVTLRIAVSGKVGSGSIRARPPRRSFWDWLLRRPRPYAIAAR
ncbi:MAG TPA: DUF1707 domain-containing protein [Streptosporangiaceae bacterium]|nr:DUF1707 domain-containing protein [Streptosporangiaceae bacterium]